MFGSNEVLVRDTPETMEWGDFGEETLNIPHLEPSFFFPMIFPFLTKSSNFLSLSPIYELHRQYAYPIGFVCSFFFPFLTVCFCFFFLHREEVSKLEHFLLDLEFCSNLLEILDSPSYRPSIFATVKSMAELFVYFGMEEKFLDNVIEKFVTQEIQETNQIGTLFRYCFYELFVETFLIYRFYGRGNSTATRIVSTFMTVVGGHLLRCLSVPIMNLVVDDQEVTGEEDAQEVSHQSAAAAAEAVLDAIIGTLEQTPNAIRLPLSFVRLFCCPLNALFRKCLAMVGQLAAIQFPDDPSARLIAIGGVIFLRFFVPAIMSPVESGLLPSSTRLSGNVTKILSVVTSSIQCLANQTLFSPSKPNSPMNELFIEVHKARVCLLCFVFFSLSLLTVFPLQVNDFLEHLCESCDVPSAIVSSERYSHSMLALFVSSAVVMNELSPQHQNSLRAFLVEH